MCFSVSASFVICSPLDSHCEIACVIVSRKKATQEIQLLLHLKQHERENKVN